MDNVNNLSYKQQQQLQQDLVNLQAKDSLSQYMNLVERCFEPCVHNFRTKYLDKSETRCLESCAERYIKASNRTGLRFQEHQAMEMKRAQDALGGASSK
jgi:import inner membrane translocase subunit TIM9